MSEIAFSSHLSAELIQYTGSDPIIAAAARVSTGADTMTGPVDEQADAGLIGYLMRNRHGSPFEHGSLTFRVEAPILVFRELMRHRIASYNETSARYRQLEPTFYVYPPERPLVQAGTGAHPKLVHAEDAETTHAVVEEGLKCAAGDAWVHYQELIRIGAALEVARAVLPVNIYSSAYVTMNPRALMNFLSLRVDSPDAAVPSKPQWEIEQIARQMEDEFAELFPITHAAFVKNGRVAP